MKHVTEPVNNTSATSPSTPSRFERLLRTVALLALGPTFLLATPMKLGTASMLASLVLAGSFLASRTVPRLLAPRLGRLGAYLATSLVLGMTGTLLGVLDGCSLGADICRYAIGVWTLTWLLLPLAVLSATSAFKALFAIPHVGLRLVRRVRARLSQYR